ncbi:MAG: DUF3575 domain-containing protein [Flavobacterium sp.]
MFPKRIFLFLLLLTSFAQGQTYIKANAVTALVLIPNVGVETTLSKHFTFQVDITASFWKSINHGPFQLFMLTPELRYHFKESTKGFYIGAHLGGSIFKLQKWNYANSDDYQKGFNYFAGGTIGYQTAISKKLALDFFLGGGTQQAFYNGYYISTNERYEHVQKYNKSGEWLPYRGGVMICYKLN